MSYPPYPQFDPYAASQPLDELLRPARRAGVLMFIVAGLMLLCGAFVGILGAIPLESMQLPPEVKAELDRLQSTNQVDLQLVFLIASAVMLIPAILMVILGIYVRKGGLFSQVSALILTALLTLFIGINALTALQQGGWPAAIVPGLLTVLLILIITQLIVGIGRAGDVKAIRRGGTPAWGSPAASQSPYQPPPPQF